LRVKFPNECRLFEKLPMISMITGATVSKLTITMRE
jgi:hypothetical protein